MRLTVRVLHNVSQDMFFQYDPKTSQLYHAHDFQVVADNVDKAADLVWALANVDDAEHLHAVHPQFAFLYDDQVTAYRKRMNRSLSVSDVLVFYEGERFAGARVVATVGHDALDTEPAYTGGDNSTEVSTSFEAHQRFHRAFR